MTKAANPLRGEAPLVVGAGTYIIRLDANALCLAEEATGLRTLELADAVSENDATLSQLRALLWAGLSAHHGKSLIETGDIISDAGIGAIRAALITTLAAAFGVSAEGKDAANPQKAVEAGTG